MTDEAAEAVERIVERPGVPDGAVLRIVAREGRSNGSAPVRGLELELVRHPQASDLVVEEMRIAVEPSSLPFLDDKVLDAELDDADVVEFRLYDQPDAG